MTQQQLHQNWEELLRQEVLRYPERSGRLWHRSYGSSEEYANSVASNRQQWAALLQPPAGTEPRGDLRIESVNEREKNISFSLHPLLTLEALYMEPAAPFSPPFPLVLFQHGIGGTADMVMGRNDTVPAGYHAVGRVLARQGFAVLAPMAVNAFQARGRINRLALLLGSHIWALEVQAIRSLLHKAVPRLAVDPQRIAMWGLSMGGAYTLYTMPLEPMFRAGIVSAWFNHRCHKMAVEDARYTCFLSVDEEHAFLPGLLTGFSDQDLVSLICPRPLLIQTGESDTIAWPPMVEEELLAAKRHYELLGCSDHLQWDRFQGGHEVRLETAVAFLKKWLS